MWAITDALTVVRSMQYTARGFNFHIALGGGVLNRGESEKDLDLYFLPMDNGDGCDFTGLLAWFGKLGGVTPIGCDDNYGDDKTYRAKVKIASLNGRIDAFVV
jgi:hypothetical protein